MPWTTAVLDSWCRHPSWSGDGPPRQFNVLPRTCGSRGRFFSQTYPGLPTKEETSPLQLMRWVCCVAGTEELTVTQTRVCFVGEKTAVFFPPPIFLWRFASCLPYRAEETHLTTPCCLHMTLGTAILSRLHKEKWLPPCLSLDKQQTPGSREECSSRPTFCACGRQTRPAPLPGALGGHTSPPQTLSR